MAISSRQRLRRDISIRGTITSMMVNPAYYGDNQPRVFVRWDDQRADELLWCRSVTVA